MVNDHVPVVAEQNRVPSSAIWVGGNHKLAVLKCGIGAPWFSTDKMSILLGGHVEFLAGYGINEQHKTKQN
ncbi:hypothetical protein DY000_02013377 [Brassica cretica]|uniref:Uncharacterized protein n=1 Tax=Brassica cretica TaxID=69181 RepID=A0ABQ7CU90_BRACR|nr:hypothetical protein DY000_02013377 [Brassica cretica]